MRVIREGGEILRQLEGIDIQNDEYVFWDANGAGVSIVVSTGPFKTKLESVASCPPAFPIREAFTLYTKTLGIIDPVVEGAPTDVWNTIQAEVERGPGKRGILSKLFRR